MLLHNKLGPCAPACPALPHWYPAPNRFAFHRQCFLRGNSPSARARMGSPVAPPRFSSRFRPAWYLREPARSLDPSLSPLGGLAVPAVPYNYRHIDYGSSRQSACQPSLIALKCHQPTTCGRQISHQLWDCQTKQHAPAVDTHRAAPRSAAKERSSPPSLGCPHKVKNWPDPPFESGVRRASQADGATVA